MFKMLLASLSRPIATSVAHGLSTVDYSVATQVTHQVARVVTFAYDHDAPWLAHRAIEVLETLDDFGSFLVALASWIIHHVY